MSDLVVLRVDDVEQVKRILAYFVAGAVLPMETALARQALDILEGAVDVTADGEVVQAENAEDRSRTGLDVQRRSSNNE